MEAPSNASTLNEKTAAPGNEYQRQNTLTESKKQERLSEEEEDMSSSDESEDDSDDDDDSNDDGEYDEDEDDYENEEEEDHGLVNDVVGKGGQLVHGAQDRVKDVGKNATKTVNGVTGGGQEDGNKPLRLRLDLNLDVEVQVKARLHGDVTLSLLA